MYKMQQTNIKYCAVPPHPSPPHIIPAADSQPWQGNYSCWAPEATLKSYVSPESREPLKSSKQPSGIA